jgi:hypothetical protein
MFIRKTFEGEISFYQMTHCSHLVKLMSGGKGQVKKKEAPRKGCLESNSLTSNGVLL